MPYIKIKRSDISKALFALIQGAWKWGTANPRLRVPDDLTGFELPAMFLAKVNEDTTEATFGLTKNHFRYVLLVVLRADSTPEDTPIEGTLDDILDAIEGVLHSGTAQTPRGPILPQTLDGLVENCWIDGRTEIDSPILFETCALWIPISVLPRGGTRKVT
jgi:hypothetical protein